MKRTLIASSAWALLYFAATPTQMCADIIYDNLSAASGATSAGAQRVGVGLADSFSTGASAVNLTDVKLLLSLNNSDSGSFLVSLNSDNSTAPGPPLDLIGLEQDSSLTTSEASYDFTLSTPIALSPNTRYWIEVTSESGSSVQWWYDSNNVGTGTASEYYFAYSSTSPNSDDPFQMQLTVANASAAPEPASWSLMLIAGLGSALALKRRLR